MWGLGKCHLGDLTGPRSTAAEQCVSLNRSLVKCREPRRWPVHVSGKQQKGQVNDRPMPGQRVQSLTDPGASLPLLSACERSENQQPPCPRSLALQDQDRWPPGKALAPAHTPGCPLGGVGGRGTVRSAWGHADPDYQLAYFPGASFAFPLSTEEIYHRAVYPRYTLRVPLTGKRPAWNPRAAGFPPMHGHTSSTPWGCGPMNTCKFSSWFRHPRFV